jgi:membrane protein implicated in regulation of membrane protease activity
MLTWFCAVVFELRSARLNLNREVRTMQWWIWLASGGVLLVVEMLTVDLLFASLAFSAFMAAGVSFFTPNLFIQGLVFSIAAVTSILLLRPIALRNLRKNTDKAMTNVDALIGTEALALSEITERSGQAKISGEIWSARSQSGVITVGSKLVVLSIEGATAVVSNKGDL